MHELSILLSIVDIAQEEFERSGASKLESIELEIGKLSGVEPHAFEFAWPEATRNTLLEHATRKIEYIQGRAQCRECKEVFNLQDLFDECPACGSYFKDIHKGRELRIRALVVS